MDSSKAPAKDGITSEIRLRIYIIFPLFLTEVYTQCLIKAFFPKEWKENISVIKPGKENSEDVLKYRPISLINAGRKVLEKLLINRIMAYMYANNFMNRNQFGFPRKRGSTEAIMELKEFTEDSLRRGDVVVVVSLDVKEALNAAWWPAVLKSLKDFKCPKKLYELSKSYFSNRLANLQLAGVKVEEKVTRDCPQGSCCGPGFWNIQYNSLLNLNYSKDTKIIAFADDVVILTKRKTVLVGENRVNIELDKVEWASINKISFHETKSQLMLATRKRSLLGKEIDVFLNNEKLNKKLKQVRIMKYLAIQIDDQLKN
ncbi:Reverse transcriptase (RNA-dependent DNA polymerase) [Popillia japonica]|uniref:Reverse transcriptase (RNA-dependent DNA polymerase) n=1 Tax=Popillia japonica TaxID=7064 RepID=A0AAW1KE76_POPJA